MSDEISSETLAKNLFKYTMAVLLLMEIEREPAYPEELSRRTGKGTGHLRKYLNPLKSLGVLDTVQDKNRVVYYATSYGKLVAETLRVLSLSHDIADPTVMDKTYDMIQGTTSFVYRSINGELFDREVASKIQSDMTFTDKLRILISTIHPHRAFNLSELHKECEIVFPSSKVSRNSISTCMTRFRDKDNRHYLPNLHYRGKGNFLIE